MPSPAGLRSLPLLPPQDSTAGQLLAVKDGIDRMLEQLDLTDDERSALEGDRDALVALSDRLADVPTPAGPTPVQLGATRRSVSLTPTHEPPEHGATT